MGNRIIKESICTSESIDQLTAFEETCFYRLLVNCDDYGRMDARPAILKARLFPLKDVTARQLTEAIKKLTMVGMVEPYESGGRPYLQLPAWDCHQQIRSHKGKYPPPEPKMDPPGGETVGVISSDISCNHMISSDIKCVPNTIQSNTNTNPNPNSNTTTTTNHVAAVDERQSAIMKKLETCWCQTVSSHTVAVLVSYLDTMELPVILRAIEISDEMGVRNAKYVQGILNSWQSEGVRRLGDIPQKRPAKAEKGAQDSPYAGLEDRLMERRVNGAAAQKASGEACRDGEKGVGL